VLGPENLDTLAAEHEYAELLGGQRKHEESARLSHEAWQGRLRHLGAEDRDTLRSENLYAEALLELAQLQEAERLDRQTLQIRERVLGPDDFDTANSLGNLAEVLETGGAYPEAERLFREDLSRLQRIGYADKREGFLCVKELAMTRLMQGDPAEAEKLLAEALPRARQSLGPDNYLTLFIQRVLVRAFAEGGRLEKAEALARETLDARLRTRANQDEVGTGRTLFYLGRVLVEENKLDEAELRLQAALTIFSQDESSKPRPELAAQAANWLGAVKLARKAYPEAETLMLRGPDHFFPVAVEMSPNERRVAVGHIVQLYQAWGKPEQTTFWQRKLDTLAPVASHQ
jgi:tetratricopeptide (TPR) repeat protein